MTPVQILTSEIKISFKVTNFVRIFKKVFDTAAYCLKWQKCRHIFVSEVLSCAQQ